MDTLTSSEKLDLVEIQLTKLYPETKCFLNYTKDYELLFAVLLSQQATDVSVNKVSSILFAKYPSLISLASAEYEDVYQIIKPIGLAKTKTKNLIATAKLLVEDYSSCIPTERQELMRLKGVGYKTATVFLAECHHFPSIAVDTHVFRVINRLGVFPSQHLSADQMSKALDAAYRGNNHINFHRQLITLGRNICFARSPECQRCPFFNNICLI